MHTCWQSKIVLLVACTAGLAGCAETRDSNYYLLSALPAADTPTASASARRTVVLAAVIVPEYLDRPQIVTRPSANRMKLAEFDRWAEPIREGTMRVMAINLRALLPGTRVLLPPEGDAEASRITVEIQRFDGTFGKDTVLDATWTLKAAGGEGELATGVAHYVETLASSDYAAYAGAQSKLIEALCRDLAVAINREMP